MFTKVLVALCLIAAVSSEGDCDNVKCAAVPKHYRELGCTPVKENNQCCPSRFECPDKSKFALDKCYWNGAPINIGDQLPEDETTSLCAASCNCAKGFPGGEPASLRCAQLECPHFFSQNLRQCDHKYTLSDCCPKYLCTEEEKATLGTATCHLDGQTYRVGASIYPESESCYKCVCSENFDNSTIIGNPNCKEINCGFELRYFNKVVHNGCIPNYFGTSGCCPIGWRCPQDSDEMIPSESRSAEPADPKATCQFGKLTLHVGDEIKSNDKCEVCKCVLPPMAHCVKTRC